VTDLADLVEPVAPAVAPGAAPDPARLRRRELGAFLRSRRERIAPEEVGLVPGGRRRTPGLRREEVAQVAGVGVTWYTWLEQGRDINVSEQVLDAIARALLLDPHEIAHLYALAGVVAPEPSTDPEAASPAVRMVLDQLDPLPACVVNARSDILAHNRVYGRLIDDLDAIPFEDRNTLWLAFTRPEWRDAIVDWEDARVRMVASLRAAMADHVADPAWKALVRRLTDASPEFARLWARHDVCGPENRTKVMRNPIVGDLRVDYTNYWLGARRGTRLVTYTPADDVTRERLIRLSAIAAG
jgi:transcriptional regulator with XRE-family HTH domain